MELFLAKLLGLYFIIVGSLILIRRKNVMPAVSDLLNNRGLIMVIGVLEIVAGLALVLAYPVLTLDLKGILAVIGYMMVIEGIVYLAMPYKKTQKMIKYFNKPWWYLSGGLVAVVIGVYLTLAGFGLL